MAEGIQQSQISTNKAFLQATGVLQPEGIALTDAGKRLGLGILHDNAGIREQGLRQIVRECALLKELHDIVRGRGSVTDRDFEAEISLRTKQGRSTPSFVTGIGVLWEILVESGLVDAAGNILRPSKVRIEEPKKVEPKPDALGSDRVDTTGLRKIPIPVSASTVWYIQVGENPTDPEIETFIEMQKLVFGKK
jgi:hypothetical protein